MKPVYQPPSTTRGRIVFFIWTNLPRMILLAMIAVIIVLTFSIIGKRAAILAEQEAAGKQERPPVNTVVLETKPMTISNRLNLPGSVEAWTTLDLTAEIAGKVERILVEEGNTVHTGDTLLQIETDDYQIALARAEAAYALAQDEYSRDRQVYDKGIIPTAEIEARRTNVQTAKADLDNARLQLSRCTVKAPIDGVVRRLDAETGMFLGVGDPLGTLLQLDRVKAVVGIPESDIGAVRNLDTIDVHIKALENRLVSGTHWFLAPSPDTSARLYRLELALENPDHAILPGMFIRADIVKQRKENVVAIPFYSIISRNNEQYVFVEKEGVVEKRNVTTGISQEWLIEITSGVQAGERVVVEGHRDIEDGRKVTVVKVLSEPGALSL